jgi:pyruvate/2-oxoglutarate dehydrogenase complex dihydrolipoamide dehydrogenase (E3) component
VAVIGAGPYGLSTGTHLKSANVTTRVFGDAMSFWRGNMPKGMKLRSPWRASHIADPNKEHSLDYYATTHRVQRTENLPVAEFVRYGEWFQRRAVPDIDKRMVKTIAPGAKGFRLHLEDGDVVEARRVVIATGLTNQAFRPAQFDGLPRSHVSHSSEAVNPDEFRGRRVAVIGRGQSACESAVLLHEAGAEVELICRGDVHWIGSENPDAEQGDGLKWWLREALAAPSAIGPFPVSWLVEVPSLLRRLPYDLRSRISIRSLRPAATAWLRPRAKGMRINPGRTVVEARAQGNKVALRLDDHSVSLVDHTVLATGYSVDVGKLGIIAPELLQRIADSAGFPILSKGFESTVPGLHFVGSPAIGSFGPLPRFVAGAGYAARCVTRAVLANRQVFDPESPRSAAASMMPSLR